MAARVVPASPVLVIDEFEKRYGNTPVISGLSLTVEAGEVVGLLGKNGAGKSTTMRAAAAIIQPTSGSVTVAGHDTVHDPVAAKAELGYVPDINGLFDRLTGWQHVEFVARLRAVPDWEHRARQLFEQFSLTDAASQRANSYSHGMQRRLSIVMAVLANPALLLLDEPFDGVDPAGSMTIRTLIGDAAQTGTAVVLSTHLLDVAYKVCDRVIVIADGHVKAAGTPAEIAATHGAGDLEAAYLNLVGMR